MLLLCPPRFIAQLLAAVTVAGSLATTASADNVLTPDQLARWQRADEALAQSDLIKARSEIAPLIEVAPTLSDGRERAWLDQTIGRILFFTRETEDSDKLVADLDRLLGADGGPTTAAVRFPSQADTTRPSGTACEVQLSLVDGVRAAEVVGSAGKLGGYIGPSMNHWTTRGPSPWSMPSGAYKLLPSYLAADRASGDLKIGYGAVTGTLCNALPVRYDGIATASKRGAISVPADQAIVEKRNVSPGSKYVVQAFATRRTKVTALWYTMKQDRPGSPFYRVPRLKTTLSVSPGGNTLTFKAPNKRGKYAGLAFAFAGSGKLAGRVAVYGDLTGFDKGTIGVGLNRDPEPGTTR